VSLRERASRAGLQVPLKPKRGMLGGKLKNDEERPRAMLDGVPCRSRIVPLETVLYVASGACVVTTRVGVALKEVDEALANTTHAGPRRHGSRQKETGRFG